YGASGAHARDDAVAAARLPRGAVVKSVSATAARRDDFADTVLVWKTLGRIPDPEIPVISVVDLGIVRGVEWQGDELIVRLTPAWTTDWIAPEARERLARFGIAPPGTCATPAAQTIDASALRRPVRKVPCPRCGSARTRELSRFGSTPCKAQYRCDDCLEPFDYFKPH